TLLSRACGPAGSSPSHSCKARRRLRPSQWTLIIGGGSVELPRRIRMAILKRQPLFPHVIELNHQARRRIGCSVYLIYDDDNNWTLIDIGYEDAVDDCLEIIRQLDFPF